MYKPACRTKGVQIESKRKTITSLFLSRSRFAHPSFRYVLQKVLSADTGSTFLKVNPKHLASTKTILRKRKEKEQFWVVCLFVCCLIEKADTGPAGKNAQPRMFGEQVAKMIHVRRKSRRHDACLEKKSPT